jgi:glycosyltransferase involved in cell wall biosynthesis
VAQPAAERIAASASAASSRVMDIGAYSRLDYSAFRAMNTPPLVSAIVRTVGRPELPRALASLAAQHYRPIEIVIVNAASIPLALPATPGLRRNVIDPGRPLPRPEAANAGLAAARGDWMIFLDEDDAIEADHIELLVATAAISGSAVAYSQTRLVDAAGATTRFLGGGPFNREALLRSNYLSIHAVLFSRAFVDAGARFDESFEIFEDWDFWLQLSERCDFAFTGKATAIYSMDSGASGAGGGANQDRERLLAQRERLMRKWLRA